MLRAPNRMMLFIGGVVACGGRTNVDFASSGEPSSGELEGGASSGYGEGGSATAGNGGAEFGGASPGTDQVEACKGLPSKSPAELIATCSDGRTYEAERLPMDLLLLMARPSFSGLGRWDALTSGVELFSSIADDAQNAALLLFGKTEVPDDTTCSSATYEVPDVPFGDWWTAAPHISAAMRQAKPAEVSPMVPALAGAFRYAARRQGENIWQEVGVVLVGDGVPTMCLAEYAVDPTTVIAQARQSTPSIRSYFVGVGEMSLLDGMRPAFINYARLGGSSAPFLLDESKGLSYLSSQLAMALHGIASAPSNSAYRAVPDTDVDRVKVAEMRLLVQSRDSKWYAIPQVAAQRECHVSGHGGWYRPDPTRPNWVRICPCTAQFVDANDLYTVTSCGTAAAAK